MKTEQQARIINGPQPNYTGHTVPDGVKAYNIIETDDNSAEIVMYGEVVESHPVDYWTGKPINGLFIALDKFLEDLDTLQSKEKITVRLNSVGGDLYAGIAIKNRLSELPGHVITIVDSLAASAASIILQAGDTRKVFPGSQVMIHGASMFAWGSFNVASLKKLTTRLNAGNKSALEIYAERTGRGKAEIEKLIAEETWMTGQEAIEQGFADELISTGQGATMAMSADNNFLMVNNIPFPMKGFRNRPQGIPAMVHLIDPMTTGAEPAVIENANNKGGESVMTLDELQEKHPELVAKIREGATNALQGERAAESAKAVEEERARIKEIEEIQSTIGDAALVQKAKYGEKLMSAADLALAAMKQQAQLGIQFLANSKEDAENSGAAGVTPVPAGSPQQEEIMNDIKAGAMLLAGVGEEGEKK